MQFSPYFCEWYCKKYTVKLKVKSYYLHVRTGEGFQNCSKAYLEEEFLGDFQVKLNDNSYGYPVFAVFR